MNPRVIIFQHQAMVGPGYLAASLERRGATLDIVRIDRGAPVPAEPVGDALIVLGGTMNVYQEEAHPWLVAENKAIQAWVASGRPVLGVCLGGQLLAKALGARVHLGGAPEVGVVPLELTAEGRADPLFAGLGEGLEFVSWHDDTFDVPVGGVRLAGSPGCANHAFRFGERAYGLQFHPEASPEILTGWLETLPADASIDRAALERAFAERADQLRERADRLTSGFLALVTGAPMVAASTL